MTLISTERKITQICLILAQKDQHRILNKYIIKILETGKIGLLSVAFTNRDTRKGQPVTKGEYCPQVRATDSSLSHSSLPLASLYPMPRITTCVIENQTEIFSLKKESSTCSTLSLDTLLL